MKALKQINALRYQASFVSEYMRYIACHRERFEAFQSVAGDVQRNRIFLVGNGPSLNDHDLGHLNGEDYILCNMAERIEWTRGKEHPFYIAADARVPDDFADGEPRLRAKTYFFEERLKPKLSDTFVKNTRIIWFSSARGGVLKRGLSARPWVSVAGGQTVLLSAAQIALFLGYREIFIIGCDLNYQSANPYAYQLPASEQKPAERDEIKMINNTNAAFAILRKSAEQNGAKIMNAGIKGNLNTLPRADFANIFKAS